MSCNPFNDDNSPAIPKTASPRLSPSQPAHRIENNIAMADIRSPSIMPASASDRRTNNQPTEGAESLTLKSTNLISEASTTFHLFRKLPPEIRLMIWSLALPKQRVVEIFLSNLSSRQSPLIAKRHSITMFAVCQESRAVALRSSNLCFLPPINGTHYLRPKALTLLFHDFDTLAAVFCDPFTRHQMKFRKGLEESVLTLAVNPCFEASRSDERRFCLANNYLDDMFYPLLRMKKIRNIEKVILFCEREDMAFLHSGVNYLQEEWKDRVERALRRGNSYGCGIGWKAPRVTSLVHERSLTIPQAQTQLDQDHLLIRDILSGFAAS